MSYGVEGICPECGGYLYMNRDTDCLVCDCCDYKRELAIECAKIVVNLKAKGVQFPDPALGD